MEISDTPAIERIARVLAGQRLSANAEGSGRSVSAEVDARWREFAGDAIAVLRSLREADQDMAAAGDPRMWTRMVLAALGQGAEAPGRLGDGEGSSPRAP